MRAEELMIGDLLQIEEPDLYSGNICKIQSLYRQKENEGAYFHVLFYGDKGCGGKEVFCDDLRPIPLTQEILEKNGFKWLMTESKCVTYCLKEPNVHATKYKDNGEWFICVGAAGSIKKRFVEVSCVKYVHELQHALKLCRIEKEIEL